MTSILLVFIGFIAAGMMLLAIPKTPKPLRIPLATLAVVVFAAFVFASSFRYVGQNEIGVIVKNIGSKSLPPGQIIATNGEMGPQANILPPGWHPNLWPFFYSVETYPVIEIKEGQIGMLTATDGQPLPDDTTYAPEWTPDQFADMLDAQHFLTKGNGYKGPQTSVLKPGKYRINPKLFKLELTDATNVEKATVGVVKSNVGPRTQTTTKLVEKGQRGIWNEPYNPSIYYINTKAYEVTIISTKKQIVRYTKSSRAGTHGDEREIIVRTSDGFTFPVDVRIEYQITPQDAPLVVATVRDDDDEGLRNVLNSAVRAIFRNNAENVKALDYVKDRSHQESQSLAMLKDEMAKIGVTIAAVRIGDIGDPQTLGELLKTQTDREIAIQQQITIQEQQRAAVQRKELLKAEQEALEEKRLATASYEVQIAEQTKLQRIIEAGADAEAIRIRAKAQADAYALIAQQIGSSNAALIELLKIIGEKGINITPRVMVANGQAADGGPRTGGQETTALIGTMLDSMLDRSAATHSPSSTAP